VSRTIRQALLESLPASAKHSRAVQVGPAAVLWTDHDEQWRAVATALRADMAHLFALGDYATEEGRGPAIWLKCVVARTLPEVKFSAETVPVIYLPGVGRTDLRAIDHCPRELQPLAELQYRGVFWSQQNGKDWTVFAYLASDNGGLGLRLAEDAATKQALQQVATEAPERLLSLKIDELEDRTLDAEYFNGLLAPDHERDLLTWMNDPADARKRWAGARWKIFVKRCSQDYQFHPEKDGELAAAEKLAAQDGAWGTVSRLYRDLYRHYPAVYGLLGRVSVPQGLFPNRAGYPSLNADMERQLRHGLLALKGAELGLARNAILNFEAQHGERREWLWAEMGHSPLAVALQPLALIARLSATPFGGTDFEDMATQYRDGLWQVDDAALHALAAVKYKEDSEAIEVALRAAYVPWIDAAATRFQELVKARGGLNAAAVRQQLPSYANHECVMFVDGLRFDVAQRLVKKLAECSLEAQLSFTWAATPSVTASGKAWASPAIDVLCGTVDGEDFEPALKKGGVANTAGLRKAIESSGWQILSNASTAVGEGRAWTECGDLDHFGHEHGLKLAREIDTLVGTIVERIEELAEGGWKKIRVVTDHGWLLVPGGLPKVDLPKFLTATRWGRCAALKENASAPFLKLGWDWNPAVTVALAPGITSFKAGETYAHGGLSLQESLVPVILIRPKAGGNQKVSVKIASVEWQGLRCKVVIESDAAELYADMRLKAADPGSSVLAATSGGTAFSGKRFENNAVSLAVGDEHEGATAALVILDAEGAMLTKQATVIGE
jgi:hypothetical protein